MSFLPDLWPLTKIQVQIYNDPSRFIWCSAGRRSRKTLLFSRKLLLNAIKTPGHYFQAAPVENQAVRIFWENPYNHLKENTRPIWTKPPNESRHIVYIRSGPGGRSESQIHVFGVKNPSRIDGSPWSGCHVTEIDECSESTWSQHVRIVMGDTGGFAYLDGVPEMGRGWYYRECLHAAGGALPQRNEELKGSFASSGKGHVYYHWKSSDVLSAAEIEDLKRTLDPVIYRLEMEGSFESMLTAAYYQFGAHNLDPTIQYNPFLPVRIGMDFNVNPMTATFSHYVQGVIMQFGEAYLPHSNTPGMIKYIKNLFPVNMCIIYPDSTGGNKTANADLSSIALLKKAGFKVQAPKQNPEVKDRLNTVNASLKNMAGEVRYKINPETCPKTIDGFNTTERKEDGTIEKDKPDKLGHNITDAAGYCVCRLIPIARGAVYSL